MVVLGAHFVAKPASWLGGDNFFFLNKASAVSSAAAWNNLDMPRLWLYNLHYFDDLGRADAVAMRDTHAGLVARWIAENPPPRGTGWEPYPLSLRIVNWIKWSLAGGTLNQVARESLASQLRALRGRLEYHLLGNHLWSNAKALIFGGLYFDGPEALRWLAKGMTIFQAQLFEQILADGGHFERSPSYHALALEDLLDVINIMRTAGLVPPAFFGEAATRMIRWLALMTDSQGHYIAWNDAPRGVVPEVSQLQPYLAALGLAAETLIAPGLHALPETGYFRFERRSYTLWVDAGPIGPDYLPGHGHADMLNFELHAHGKPLVTDVGVSTYDANSIRLYERGTAAHNTVQIGDIDQSEVWSSFRVGRRARIVDRVVSADGLIAGHTGYRRLGVTHSRSFVAADEAITIVDMLPPLCSGTARIHLAPGAHPERTPNGFIVNGARFIFSRHEEMAFCQYPFARGFNDQQMAIVVNVTFSGRLETSIEIIR
jgi:uncharacterized heparinase superfamily protein